VIVALVEEVECVHLLTRVLAVAEVALSGDCSELELVVFDGGGADCCRLSECSLLIGHRTMTKMPVIMLIYCSIVLTSTPVIAEPV